MQKYFALFLLLFVPVYSIAFTVPEKPTGFVQDYAQILSFEQAQTLENKLEQFERGTTNEIAVVTIPSLDGDVIESVAQEIFTKWGIGKKDKNNGVLLLISLQDRKTRIHTGYGVEGDLTDVGTSYIQQDIIAPAFRGGDYYAGIDGAVDKIIFAIGGNDIVPVEYKNDYRENPDGDWGAVFLFGFVLLQWLLIILARSKSWWLGGIIGGGIGGLIWYFALISLVPSIILFILFTLFGLGFDYV